MSGRRTKALRREFERIHGRAPEIHEQRSNNFFGRIFRFLDITSGEPKTVKRRVLETQVTSCVNEFRRFKRRFKRRAR